MKRLAENTKLISYCRLVSIRQTSVRCGGLPESSDSVGAGGAVLTAQVRSSELGTLVHVQLTVGALKNINMTLTMNTIRAAGHAQTPPEQRLRFRN